MFGLYKGVRFLTAIKKKVRYPGEQLLLFGKNSNH
jgi:hypothetical protein